MSAKLRAERRSNSREAKATEGLHHRSAPQFCMKRLSGKDRGACINRLLPDAKGKSCANCIRFSNYAWKPSGSGKIEDRIKSIATVHCVKASDLYSAIDLLNKWGREDMILFFCDKDGECMLSKWCFSSNFREVMRVHAKKYGCKIIKSAV